MVVGVVIIKLKVNLSSTSHLTSQLELSLAKWGVKHCLSSVANPHSNCRAELGVKPVKTMITDNCGPSGSLDVDSFHRAILSYRNTADPVTKVSPAMAEFGRQL